MLISFSSNEKWSRLVSDGVILHSGNQWPLNLFYRLISFGDYFECADVGLKSLFFWFE